MRQSNRRTPVVFHVGLVLFCLVLFSTYLTGGLYARYTTTASGSDSARVAKFQITSGSDWTAGQDIHFELNFFDPAKQSQTITLQILSNSEVAVKYDVVLTMPDLPSGCNYDWLEVTIGEKNPTVEGNVFTFTNLGEFSPNYSGSSHEHALIIKIRDDLMGTPPLNFPDIKNGDVQITIHAEQID